MQLEKEFNQHKGKFMEKKASQVWERAEEEMVAAQDALKDAAASHSALSINSKEDELKGARVSTASAAASPNRTLNKDVEDP